MCLFNSRKGTSKINLRSFSEHFRFKSSYIQALKESNIWKLGKFECFWIYIHLPAEDDDMGILWGMMFTELNLLCYFAYLHNSFSLLSICAEPDFCALMNRVASADTTGYPL